MTELNLTESSQDINTHTHTHTHTHIYICIGSVLSYCWAWLIDSLLHVEARPHGALNFSVLQESNF